MEFKESALVSSQIRYPEVFKTEVVNKVLKEGLSLAEASRKYGIKGHTNDQEMVVGVR